MVTPVSTSTAAATSSSAAESPSAPAPNTAAMFQEKLANIFKAAAPVCGDIAQISAQLGGVDPSLATVIGKGVTISVQQSADPAAAVSVQGGIKSGELAKSSFETISSKK